MGRLFFACSKSNGICWCRSKQRKLPHRIEKFAHKCCKCVCAYKSTHTFKSKCRFYVFVFLCNRNEFLLTTFDIISTQFKIAFFFSFLSRNFFNSFTCLALVGRPSVSAPVHIRFVHSFLNSFPFCPSLSTSKIHSQHTLNEWEHWHPKGYEWNVLFAMYVDF